MLKLTLKRFLVRPRAHCNDVLRAGLWGNADVGYRVPTRWRRVSWLAQRSVDSEEDIASMFVLAAFLAEVTFRLKYISSGLYS